MLRNNNPRKTRSRCHKTPWKSNYTFLLYKLNFFSAYVTSYVSHSLVYILARCYDLFFIWLERNNGFYGHKNLLSATPVIPENTREFEESSEIEGYTPTPQLLRPCVWTLQQLRKQHPYFIHVIPAESWPRLKHSIWQIARVSHFLFTPTRLRV